MYIYLKKAGIFFFLLSILFQCEKKYIYIEVQNKIKKEKKEFNIETVGKEPALNFGLTANFYEEEKLKRAFAPFIYYLSEKLDRKIRFVIAFDYEQLVEFLDEGKIHFGTFPTNIYAKARGLLGKKIKYVATGVLHEALSHDMPYYRGVIFSKTGSNIKTLNDLKGKSFAFTDKNSTSGYKYCLSKLLKNGINPRKHIKKILFLGDHRSTVREVVAGNVDAGVTVEGIWWEFTEENPGKLQKIAYTDLIPAEAFCVGKNFPSKKIKTLQKALLAINKKTRNSKNELIVNMKDRFQFQSFAVRSPAFYDHVEVVRKLVDKYEKAEKK
jgi:phosphonate transport system substrate-binding protein